MRAVCVWLGVWFVIMIKLSITLIKCDKVTFYRCCHINCCYQQQSTRREKLHGYKKERSCCYFRVFLRFSNSMKLSTTNKLNTQQYTHTPHTITIIIYTFNCLLLICSMRKKSENKPPSACVISMNAQNLCLHEKISFSSYFLFSLWNVIASQSHDPDIFRYTTNITFNSTIQKHRNENSTKFDVPYTQYAYTYRGNEFKPIW